MFLVASTMSLVPAAHAVAEQIGKERGYNLVLEATEGGVVGEPQVPPGERGFDELLGEEVEKYHGELRVTVPVDSVAPDVDTVQLTVRSQGCMEDVLCYPPTAQRIEVRLPPGGAEPPPQASAGLADTPLLGDYEPPALSAEEAFRFESIGLDPGTALLRFTAQPGYYLYVDKFEFSVAGADGFVTNPNKADTDDDAVPDDDDIAIAGIVPPGIGDGCGAECAL